MVVYQSENFCYDPVLVSIIVELLFNTKKTNAKYFKYERFFERTTMFMATAYSQEGDGTAREEIAGGFRHRPTTSRGHCGFGQPPHIQTIAYCPWGCVGIDEVFAFGI